MIKSYHAAGTRIAAVCTGTMAVAASGILSSRPAITHYRAIEDLRATGACIVEARVVDDGDIVTCGGVTSALDLALWLVEDAFGAELSDRVADSIEYVRDARVWRTAVATAATASAEAEHRHSMPSRWPTLAEGPHVAEI